MDIFFVDTLPLRLFSLSLTLRYGAAVLAGLPIANTNIFLLLTNTMEPLWLAGPPIANTNNFLLLTNTMVPLW